MGRFAPKMLIVMVTLNNLNWKLCTCALCVKRIPPKVWYWGKCYTRRINDYMDGHYRYINCCYLCHQAKKKYPYENNTSYNAIYTKYSKKDLESEKMVFKIVAVRLIAILIKTNSFAWETRSLLINLFLKSLYKILKGFQNVIYYVSIELTFQFVCQHRVLPGMKRMSPGSRNTSYLSAW